MASMVYGVWCAAAAGRARGPGGTRPRLQHHRAPSLRRNSATLGSCSSRRLLLEMEPGAPAAAATPPGPRRSSLAGSTAASATGSSAPAAEGVAESDEGGAAAGGTGTAPRKQKRSLAREALLRSSIANSRASRTAMERDRFRTVWSQTNKGSAVTIEEGRPKESDEWLVARQQGTYPRSDGTSVWAEDPLPEGRHYFEVRIDRAPGDLRPGETGAVGESLRGGCFIGVALATRMAKNDDGELEEVMRDCAHEQYLFKVAGCWGIEDSPCMAGGSLRCDGEPHGGEAQVHHQNYGKRSNGTAWAPQLPTEWALPPEQRNRHNRAFGSGERVGIQVAIDSDDSISLNFFRSTRLAVHVGTCCAASGMSPIVGRRWHSAAANRDLCHREYLKLPAGERAQFEQLQPPPNGLDGAEGPMQRMAGCVITFKRPVRYEPDPENPDGPMQAIPRPIYICATPASTGA
jgi:hypothetical protein